MFFHVTINAFYLIYLFNFLRKKNYEYLFFFLHNSFPFEFIIHHNLMCLKLYIFISIKKWVITKLLCNGLNLVDGIKIVCSLEIVLNAPLNTQTLEAAF